ncbi:hypothetical protein JANAI62_17300 [Jannaschia pagri]|uniref:DM13 domain-containing protein n=1 Tax=Jannaschia pagri TaxID=2829797 RepID=A0ABQ4NL06_9RHOB|nr:MULTISPECIES: DM13 domain-containing protein [unclassified Jannaschia]GIT91274.1 hypothetical protein JANAI61_17320 [Jannaschia sp. AI_61]GIT95107.1 hypothetical protein JANAI62_17300 [Jannaschia sp. AI_62]
MVTWIVRGITHGIAVAVGFALGIYFLPILTAPPAPSAEELAAMSEGATYQAELTRDLAGSDFLHWGEGTIALGPERIVHTGRLAPGPDYKLYLTTVFVEDEAAFAAARPDALHVGDVRSFDGFVLDVPEGVDLEAYTTVVVWCESFGEFITAGTYR